jgi:uncharacterized protein YqeY
MSLQERIDTEIKDAMRAKAAAKLSLLRMLKSAFKYASIEKGGAEVALDDAEALNVVRREIKKREDSVESYEKGGRPELAEKERVEIGLLAGYLPKALAPEEVEVLVREAIAEVGATSRQQMGAVMKVATANAAGRVDGRTLSSEVQKQLT